MVLVGMFTAIMTVISQISLPMPSGMPITIQVFGIALIGVILGWRLGFITTIIYILIGAVGVPVFSNFRGGISVLVSVTGGYILSWPIMVIFCGIRPKMSGTRLNFVLTILFSLIGLAINELAGGLQWALVAGNRSLWGILTYSLVAFVPKDVILTVLAVIIGYQMRKLLFRFTAL